MDARIPQVPHADNLSGVSGAQCCQNEMISQPFHLMGCIMKTAWSVCLSVTQGGGKSLMLKLLCDPWTKSAKAWHFIRRTLGLLVLLLFVGPAETPLGKDFHLLLQLGKQRPKQTWVNDANSHVPSSSPRATGVCHREISKLKSLRRALKLSLKVKQKAGEPFSGTPASELLVGHGSVRQTDSLLL